MTQEHTPGPWSYVRNPENTRWIIDSSPAHAIACTAGHEPDNEANARLIAEAPRLLEELSAAVGYMLNAAIGLEAGGSKRTAIDTLNAGRKRAKVVLDRATGAA